MDSGALTSAPKCPLKAFEGFNFSADILDPLELGGLGIQKEKEDVRILDPLFIT